MKIEYKVKSKRREKLRKWRKGAIKRLKRVGEREEKPRRGRVGICKAGKI
jgi:hypothetical protein